MLLDPVHSLIHFGFYREVVGRSFLRAAGYLVYLGFAFSIASTAALKLRLGPVIEETVQWAMTTVPTITLENGKASTEKPGPHLISHPKVPEVSILIETERTDALTPQEMEQKKVTVYLTQNTLFVMERNKMEAIDLSKGKGQEKVVVGPEFFQKAGALLSTMLYPVAFFATWGVFFFWKLCASVIYALVGLILNAFAKAGLEFDAIFKLAVYAQTPAIILQAAQLFLPRPIPLFSLISLLVVGVYLWQAIRAAAVGGPEAVESIDPA